MVFSSSIFLLYFLPLFLILYQIINKKYKNLLILAFSIFFYSWGAPKFVFVILGSTIIDFYIVKSLYETTEERRRKLLLGVSISINLGLLLFFKYANFFVDNINDFLSVFGFDKVAWTSIVLPIGISFYTFQTLTYSIDVYKRRHKPLNRMTDYLLYIMSFPQMIAGPIVRFNQIADEITGRIETADKRLIGLYRFIIGLSKKVLIANVMGEQADLLMGGDLTALSTSGAWLGILAYTFQIYFDFSGYSDMAIGLGKMMGFTFPENFNSPYTSKSISEFWRRWHITLGAFMRDYLYIPLGGSKVDSKLRLFFNLWIVFLLSGLWHGASWNFVIWGAYHGVFLILERLFLTESLKKAGNFISLIVTFFVVMMGWVIFRLERMDEIIIYFDKLFSFNSFELPKTIGSFYYILILAIIFSFIVELKVGKRIDAYLYGSNEYKLKEHLGLLSMSILLFIISLSSIVSSGFNPFIYFRF